jgi:hypothetical protein
MQWKPLSPYGSTTSKYHQHNIYLSASSTCPVTTARDCTFVQIVEKILVSRQLPPHSALHLTPIRIENSSRNALVACATRHSKACSSTSARTLRSAGGDVPTVKIDISDGSDRSNRWVRRWAGLDRQIW